MTRSTDHEILDQAIAWHLRLQPGDARDWEEFSAWLEADPERSDVFDSVENAHAAMTVETFPPTAMAEPDDHAERSNSRRWAGFAAAAAVLVVAVVSYPLLNPGPNRYAIATGAGERRTVDLADGGSAILNGETRLILDHNDPRFAQMDQGEATFRVRHDPDHPFTLVTGGSEVRDVGTVFNVAVSKLNGLRLEVAEGSVVYDPDGRAIPLKAGQTLRTSAQGAALGRIDPKAIGGWQHGQLSFTTAPLSRVAEDVSRTQGAAIKLDPVVAGLSFTGSIRISGDPGATAADLAASVGLSARKTSDGWIIERKTHGSP